MKKILGSLTIIGLTLALATGLSRAFFSDTETSRDNTLTAGKIDLLIDNTSYYNGAPNGNTTWTPENLTNHLFFNFTDIKPGDWGEDTISLYVDDNDAWACMKISLTADDDNTCTDPEDDAGVDPSCNEPDGDLFDGELGKSMTFIFWADDGDNVLEQNEVEKIFKKGQPHSLFDGSNWVISDSTGNIWDNTITPLDPTKTYYIGKAWCFGVLDLDPVATGAGVDPTVNPGVKCDGTLVNNATQTDILLADVEFSAEQSRNNSEFMCGPKLCQTRWADSVVKNVQGKRKDGTNVLATRTNPVTGLVAQTAGNPYDSPVTEGTFYSLGFLTNGALGNYVIVSFNSAVFDFPGNDLKIYEVTGGTVYPDEKIMVEVSKDNSTWTTLNPNPGVRDQVYDINGQIDWFKYVKITAVSDINLFESTADDYDLDGVQAVCNPV